jgi:hypothetical protein
MDNLLNFAYAICFILNPEEPDEPDDKFDPAA